MDPNLTRKEGKNEPTLRNPRTAILRDLTFDMVQYDNGFPPQ
jgi:hypothetical protein